MIELFDCHVPLPRAEGCGAKIADAIAHRTSTIATTYLGNLEFQTESISHLMPSDVDEVGPLGNHYPARYMWANRGPETSSTAMREIFDNRLIGGDLADRALRRVSFEHPASVTKGQLVALFLLAPTPRRETR